MRNLTIKREKRFVACAVKAKVYIEDPENQELEINGVGCRKLGELKNGEEKTFQIGVNAARVYVIGDKMSRNYCNDYYPLPAGEEDVQLTGRNCYNPGAGNPFRFDGVTDEQVLANRKKGRNKGWLVLIAAILIGAFAGRGCASAMLAEDNDPQTFTDGGMIITLTEEFDEAQTDNYSVCYESREAVVLALEEPFTLMDGLEDYTVEEYAELVLYANDVDAQVRTTDGVVWFAYTSDDPENDLTYWYFATAHKADDAFWLVQFATTDELAAEYEDLFLQWAKTIRFE